MKSNIFYLSGLLLVVMYVLWITPMGLEKQHIEQNKVWLKYDEVQQLHKDGVIKTADPFKRYYYTTNISFLRKRSWIPFKWKKEIIHETSKMYYSENVIDDNDV